MKRRRHASSAIPPLPEVPPDLPPELPRQIADECWDALLPDDDYDPAPDPRDFWIEPD